MKCSQIKKMISPYVDDELNPGNRKVFLSHIEGCDLCRQELKRVEKVHQIFASAERYQAPYGFETAILARVSEATDSRLPWPLRALRVQSLFAQAAKAALALAVIAIGIVSGSILATDRSTERQAAARDSFSLDLFQATPPGSISGIYVSLMRGDQ